jgi:hypothetical protein
LRFLGGNCGVGSFVLGLSDVVVVVVRVAKGGGSDESASVPGRMTDSAQMAELVGVIYGCMNGQDTTTASDMRI